MTEVPRKEDLDRSLNRSVVLPSLREVRQNRSLTQRELGKLANVSTNTIYQLENGLRGGYAVTVRKLASALGVMPSDLMRERRLELGEAATPQRRDLPSDPH